MNRNDMKKLEKIIERLEILQNTAKNQTQQEQDAMSEAKSALLQVLN